MGCRWGAFAGRTLLTVGKMEQFTAGGGTGAELTAPDSAEFRRHLEARAPAGAVGGPRRASQAPRLPGAQHNKGKGATVSLLFVCGVLLLTLAVTPLILEVSVKLTF